MAAPPTTGWRRAGWAVLVPLVLLVGCGESPTEVFERARAAVESKDFDALTETLTERSAKLLRRLSATKEATRGRYLYMKDLFEVLPEKGDVLEEYIDGNLAQLRVGKNERNAETIVLLRELDGWRIDIFDSPRFWRPLTFTSPEKEGGS